jgi:hypothetical protein
LEGEIGAMMLSILRGPFDQFDMCAFTWPTVEVLGHTIVQKVIAHMYEKMELWKLPPHAFGPSGCSGDALHNPPNG